MSESSPTIFSLYERIWHWLQAAAIGTLLLTGLSVHHADMSPIPFATAVRVHNLLGFVLVANAGLGLFYYLTSGAIRQFLPEPRDFLSLSARQLHYYLRGMFRNEPHPLEKTPTRRLNPLQQATYLAILNVLLPLQVVTGLLMWGAQQAPAAVALLGGLAPLAWIHTLGAWLFAAFLIAHLYLITTGPTLLGNLRAMVMGKDEG
jgi:thiosulfate reductase cytochrome b subunit